MSLVADVVEYPEEGITILSDSRGKFLMFRETDSILPIEEDLDPVLWPSSWRLPQVQQQAVRL